MRTTVATRIAIVAVVMLAVSGASLAAYGYVFGFDNPRATAGPGTPLSTTSSSTTSTTVPVTTTTVRSTTTTTHPAMKQPPTLQMPAGYYTVGSSGAAVLAYEQRLAALHFDPGPVDGRFDQDTAYAIEAVQKLYNLPRTGSIDGGTRLALSVFHWPKSYEPLRTADGDRVEIDLDRQVLVLYQSWQIRLITTVSTGSGERFCGGDDGCQYAVTPPGKFKFDWYYDGWRTSKLGHLYKPYYFNGGIAVHGYTSVPTYPASHGCARIPMHIADYFHTLVHHGETVDVFGTPSGPLTPPTPIPTTAPPVSTSSSTPPSTPPTTHPTTSTTRPRSTTTTTHPPSTTTTTHPTTTT